MGLFTTQKQKKQDIKGLDTIDFKDKLSIYDIDVDKPFEDTIAIMNNIHLINFFCVSANRSRTTRDSVARVIVLYLLTWSFLNN